MTDRELDALVAEKVMRLLPCSDPLGLCEASKTKPIQCWGTGAGGSELKSYSTDISAAWEIVDAIRPTGSSSFSLNRFHSHQGKWMCEFGHNKVEDVDTAPRAICLAALKACGYDPQKLEQSGDGDNPGPK